MAETKRKSAAKVTADKPTREAVKGYVIDSSDPAEVAKRLAECVPEWDDLKEPQREELVRHSIRSRERPTRAKVSSVTKDGVTQISPPEKHQASHAIRIYETFATSSDDIVMTRIMEIQSLFASASDPAQKMSAALAFVDSCKPENEHQSAMATQMALIHESAMSGLASAKRAEYMENYEKYSNQANKLLRTFAVLSDSYAKLQRGGIQTVKHVNVYEGGQAVVADTVHTGGANVRPSNSAHATIVGASMLGHDPQGNGVPISCGAEQEALPDARRREG